MKKNNVYVDIHVLQNVPPSCINRDDTGSPKTAMYGGARRSRVSSQSWKHAMRDMLREDFEEDKLGKRTKKVPEQIAKEIMKKDSSIDKEKAEQLAKDVFKACGFKLKNGNSAVLLFFSDAQISAWAELAIKGCEDKPECIAELSKAPAVVDIALFGRMVASEPTLKVDAAAQVAHAISTHAVHNEYDFFTAVDDLQKDDEPGAGQLGTVEFNSATLYRYATVNARELAKNLGNASADAIRGFVEAFIRSMPTGKQNTFANRTMPDYIYISLRTDQPINLVGAFEKPVSGRVGGYLEESEKEFAKYAEKVYKNYACEPEKVWTFEDGNIEQILDAVKTAVAEKLSESEGV